MCTNFVYDVLSTSWHCDSRQKVCYVFKLEGMIVYYERGVQQYDLGNTGLVKRRLEHTSMAREIFIDFLNVNSE